MIQMDKRVRPYLMIKALLTWMIVLLVLIGASVGVYFLDWPTWLYYIFIGIIVLWLVSFVILRPIIYSRVTSYQLHEDRIVVRQGFFTVKTQMIPIKRAQGVTFNSGPLSRKYNLGIVEIKTAGTGIMMPPLKIEEARSLKQNIVDLVKGESSDV